MIQVEFRNNEVLAGKELKNAVRSRRIGFIIVSFLSIKAEFSPSFFRPINVLV